MARIRIKRSASASKRGVKKAARARSSRTGRFTVNSTQQTGQSQKTFTFKISIKDQHQGPADGLPAVVGQPILDFGNFSLSGMQEEFALHFYNVDIAKLLEQEPGIFHQLASYRQFQIVSVAAKYDYDIPRLFGRGSGNRSNMAAVTCPFEPQVVLGLRDNNAAQDSWVLPTTYQDARAFIQTLSACPAFQYSQSFKKTGYLYRGYTHQQALNPIFMQYQYRPVGGLYSVDYNVLYGSRTAPYFTLCMVTPPQFQAKAFYNVQNNVLDIENPNIANVSRVFSFNVNVEFQIKIVARYPVNPNIAEQNMVRQLELAQQDRQRQFENELNNRQNLINQMQQQQLNLQNQIQLYMQQIQQQQQQNREFTPGFEEAPRQGTAGVVAQVAPPDPQGEPLADGAVGAPESLKEPQVFGIVQYMDSQLIYDWFYQIQFQEMGGSYRDMCPKLVQYYNEGYNHCCMYKIIKHTTETFNSRTASDDVEIPDKYRVMFNKLVPLLLQNYNRNISSFDNFIAFVKWALGELGETSIDIATQDFSGLGDELQDDYFQLHGVVTPLQPQQVIHNVTPLKVVMQSLFMQLFIQFLQVVGFLSPNYLYYVGTTVLKTPYRLQRTEPETQQNLHENQICLVQQPLTIGFLAFLRLLIKVVRVVVQVVGAIVQTVRRIRENEQVRALAGHVSSTVDLSQLAATDTWFGYMIQTSGQGNPVNLSTCVWDNSSNFVYNYCSNYRKFVQRGCQDYTQLGMMPYKAIR